MDEDEKEMLQEARARLSNTRGKKAKRKMREKQLEEGRRLATVQRKRELRATGIDIELKKRIKPKVREMNYMVEIPFQHYVPKGVYDPDAAPEPTRDQLMISAQQIEGSMRDELEAKRKIDDEKRMQRLKELNLPVAIQKINKANEEAIPIKRSRLVLPTPQLTEEQIESYARGRQEDYSNTNNVTNTLISNWEKYENLVDPTQIVTPVEENSIQMEAYNAILMNRTSTPLLGGLNPQLYPTDLSPMNRTMTPNLIASQITNFSGRDEMAINTLKDTNWDHEFKKPAALTKEKLELLSAINEAELLKKQLDSIPEPSNQIEFDIPELEDPDVSDDSKEDYEDMEIEEQDLKEALKSNVVKRNLPRPFVFNPKRYKESADNSLITDELVSLVLYDMHQYPMKGGKMPPDCPDKELFSDSLMSRTKKLINEELQNSERIDLMKIDETYDRYQYSFTDKKAIEKGFISEQKLKDNANVEIKQYMTHLGKIKDKYEDEIKIDTKELQRQAVRLEKAIEKNYEKYDTLRIENSVFESLYQREKLALGYRVSGISSLIEIERKSQSELEQEIERLEKEEEAWIWANRVIP